MPAKEPRFSEQVPWEALRPKNLSPLQESVKTWPEKKEPYITKIPLCSFAAVGNWVMLLEAIKQLMFPADLHIPSWIEGEDHKIHFLEKVRKFNEKEEEDLRDILGEL